MYFFSILLVTVQLYLTLLTADDSEELYIVKHPSTNKLTCMSKDDDAALVWNYDLSMDESSDSFNNFKPVKPINENSTRCAVWRSKECLVAWNGLENWRIESSFTRDIRMGPVVDYRWEGLKKGHAYEWKPFRYGWIYEFTDYFVFSVRGVEDTQFRLCNELLSKCLVITITGKGRYSAIKYCDGDITGDSQPKGNGNCQERSKVEHKTPMLDAHVWRAVRLQWDVKMRIIKVFSDMETEAFLQWNFTEPSDLCYVGIASAAEASIKIHDYDFISPDCSSMALNTAPFFWNNSTFCVNMLVSLCPQCQLHVCLVGVENGEQLANKAIHGNPDFGTSELKLWQSIKLNVSLLRSISTSIKVKIVNTVNEENCTDAWWAINNLRLCEQNNGVRESTIQLPSSDKNTAEPHISCQKLFHNKTVSVDLSKSKPYSTINQLRECIRHEGKPFFPDYKNCSGVDDNLFDILSHQGFRCLPTGVNLEVFREENYEMVQVECNGALQGLNKTWLGLILIPMICLLLAVLFIWHWRHGQALVQTNHAQNISLDLQHTNSTNLSSQTNYIEDIPVDPVYSTIPENLGDLQTTSSQNVPSDSPYMIPIDWSSKTSHTRKVPSDPLYFDVSGSSEKQISCPQGVSLNPEYENIPACVKDQTSFLHGDPSNPLYMNIDSGEAKEDTSCPQSSRSVHLI